MNHPDLSRHGFSLHNLRSPKTLNIGNPPLHPIGYAEAFQHGQWRNDHGGLDVIVAAPADISLRGYQTGTTIADLTGAQLVTDHRAGEYRWGSWAGILTSAVFTDYESQRAADLQYDYRPNPSAMTMREAHDEYAELIGELVTEFPDAQLEIVGSSHKTKCYIGVEAGLTRDQIRTDVTLGNCAILQFIPAPGNVPTTLFTPQF